MSRYVANTYSNFRFVRIILKIIAIAALIFVVLFVSLFIGLRKYIVYTDDGLRLDVPFLMEDDAKP